MASTGTKDPKAPDILYVKELAAPLAADGGDCEAVIAEHEKVGIDVDELAARLQDDGAKAFVKFWNQLLAVIESKSAALDSARSGALGRWADASP
jgi:transaldolase